MPICDWFKTMFEGDRWDDDDWSYAINEWGRMPGIDVKVVHFVHTEQDHFYDCMTHDDEGNEYICRLIIGRDHDGHYMVDRVELVG